MLSIACACADPAVRAACASKTAAPRCIIPPTARCRPDVEACGADWAAGCEGAARSAALQIGFCCVLTAFDDHPLAVLRVGTIGKLMAAPVRQAAMVLN